MSEINSAQAAAWDGAQGEFWTHWAQRFDRGVAAHHVDLMAAAQIQTTDTILDVGCGTGQVTRDAARLALQGSALGVDLSAEQLAAARTRAAQEQLTNVTFLRVDAQIEPFEPNNVDVVISRHGVMFFDDPAAAFTNLARALRPGGRLALLTWQPAADNEWLTAFRAALTVHSSSKPTTPGPESLSDPDHVRDLLANSGFTDVALTGLHHPMWFGDDADDAYEFLTGQFARGLADMTDTARSTALNSLCGSLVDHATSEGVVYKSAAWLITARS